MTPYATGVKAAADFYKVADLLRNVQKFAPMAGAAIGGIGGALTADPNKGESAIGHGMMGAMAGYGAGSMARNVVPGVRQAQRLGQQAMAEHHGLSNVAGAGI